MESFSYRLKIFCMIYCWFGVFGPVYATKQCYANMSEVLPCFLHAKDNTYKYELLSVDESKADITIKTYMLYSQKWPIKTYPDIPTTVWKHKLVVYIPKQIAYSKVLLHVIGGNNRNMAGVEDFVPPREQLDYARIALYNKAPVVEVQDVPNQYLLFNKMPVREDQIIAYTYKKFMENPMQNAYLAGHLPMAKAVLKAMDATQEILKKERGLQVAGFVLSGTSKRGWAVWLAALGDNRVEAIVPIVIDVLNTQKSINHICQSHGGRCPIALRDYEKYNFIKMLNEPVTTELMMIEDPYKYLASDKYKARFSIPKYIINASGDDFFVPDSSRWYFKDLPGDCNHIRYLPNTLHYFRGNALSDSTSGLQMVNDALNSYFYFVLNQITLPKVSWKLEDDRIDINSSVKPYMVKLWSANNKYARDFRFISSYTHFHIAIRRVLYDLLGNMCDNCYVEDNIPVECGSDNSGCKIDVALPYAQRGWVASFVELYYKVNRIPFVVTTEVNIEPDVMPGTLRSRGPENG